MRQAAGCAARQSQECRCRCRFASDLTAASCRRKMNNFDLIEQIQLRLPLWDKAHYDKTDVNTREILWDEVAQIMGCSREILKSRWKNLRDSYRKIIRKSGDSEVDPKWPYYNAMEFMREIILNVRPKVVDITKRLGEQQRGDDEETIDAPIETIVKEEKGVKRHANDDLMAHFLEMEAEKGRDEDKGRNEARSLLEDDDYQFLLSLHPHMKQVPHSRKLPLRMKIEQLIYDEVYVHTHASY